MDHRHRAGLALRDAVRPRGARVEGEERAGIHAQHGAAQGVIPRQPVAQPIRPVRTHTDGGRLERLTWTESFASFPLFSRDGSKLVFCSSRGASAPRDLNVFIADWIP